MIVDERTLATLTHEVGRLTNELGHPLLVVAARTVGPGVGPWARFLTWTYEAAAAGHRPALDLLEGAHAALEQHATTSGAS